jgi:hypothetical protein
MDFFHGALLFLVNLAVWIPRARRNHSNFQIRPIVLIDAKLFTVRMIRPEANLSLNRKKHLQVRRVDQLEATS